MPETYITTSTINLAGFANALEPHLNCMINSEYLDSIGLIDEAKLDRTLQQMQDNGRIVTQSTLECEVSMEVEQQVEERVESLWKAHVDSGTIVTVGQAEEIAVNMAREHLDDIDWGCVVSDNLDIYWLCEEVENHVDYDRLADELDDRLDSDYTRLDIFEHATSLMENEILELKNQVEICRRAIDVLLTAHERTIKQRVRRALFTLTSRVRRAWANRPRFRITRGGN
jgi:hypothetical protein